MLKFNYYSHLLLNSKYKIFIILSIYLLIVFIYNLCLNETNIIECMDRQLPIAPRHTYLDYMRELEIENQILKERITSLENDLRAQMEQAYLNKLTYDMMLNSLAEKNSVLQMRIEESHKIIENMMEKSNYLRHIASEQKR